jgi:hypothetical protein
MTNTLEMFPTTINRCTPSERRTAASQGIAEKCDIDVVWTTYHDEKFALIDYSLLRHLLHLNFIRHKAANTPCLARTYFRQWHAPGIILSNWRAPHRPIFSASEDGARLR